MQWFQNIITTHRQRTKTKETRSTFQSSSDIYEMSGLYYQGNVNLLSRGMWETAACAAGIIIINKVSESLTFVIHPLMLIFIAYWLVEWPLEIREVDVKYSFVTISSSRTADILDVSRVLSFGLFSIFWAGRRLDKCGPRSHCQPLSLYPAWHTRTDYCSTQSLAGARATALWET